MDLPIYFREKVIRTFGKKGREWILRLPDIYSMCVNKWKLINLTIIHDLSFNLIYFGESHTYGPIVLKIGVAHNELLTEMKALYLYKGRNICKCYDIDEELGALLIERIIPGKNLTALQNTRDQLMIAADLIAKIPIPVENTHGLPVYVDKVREVFERARKENKVGTKMIFFIDAAERLLSEIEKNNYPKVLLHGDLHHWNILEDQNGSWKAIDPHGFIGIPYIEPARFMENQLKMIDNKEKLNCLEEMITVFSNKLKESKRIIALCLFIDKVLSTCWLYEDNAPSDVIMKAIDDCEFILNYVGNV